MSKYHNAGIRIYHVLCSKIYITLEGPALFWWRAAHNPWNTTGSRSVNAVSNCKLPVTTTRRCTLCLSIQRRTREQSRYNTDKFLLDAYANKTPHSSPVRPKGGRLFKFKVLSMFWHYFCKLLHWMHIVLQWTMHYKKNYCMKNHTDRIKHIFNQMWWKAIIFSSITLFYLLNGHAPVWF